MINLFVFNRLKIQQINYKLYKHVDALKNRNYNILGKYIFHVYILYSTQHNTYTLQHYIVFVVNVMYIMKIVFYLD